MTLFEDTNCLGNDLLHNELTGLEIQAKNWLSFHSNVKP